MPSASCVITLVGLLFSACKPSEKGESTVARPDSSRETTDSIAPVVPAAPSGESPPRPVMSAQGARESASASGLIGTWDVSPPAGRRGPQITLTIDSARGSNFYGRLTRALAGDVELNETSFRPFTGTVGADSVARASIESSERGAPATVIAGRITADRWSATSLVWGGIELAGPDRPWEARKTP